MYMHAAQHLCSHPSQMAGTCLLQGGRANIDGERAEGEHIEFGAPI